MSTDQLALGQRPIRVGVVDDYAELRENLGTLIRSEPDMSLAGSAATGQEAVDMAQRTRPDVILMDVEMPEMDGLTATEIIKNTVPSCSTIVLLYEQPSEYEAR